VPSAPWWVWQRQRSCRFSVTTWVSTSGFLPAVLGIVAFVDLLSAYLLVQQYRSEGDPRELAMACAYTASLVVMIGYAGAFPGALSANPPFATAASVAPWLYVIWHTGFPVLLALAWAPWPSRWTALCRPEARASRLWAAQLLTLAGAVALVVVLVRNGPALPVLIVGRDFTAMTRLTAPVAVPLVVISAIVTTYAMRRRSGPERWCSTAVWVCLIDLLLTYGARIRFSAGWYAGRTLTVIAATVVLVAMLHETTQLKAALRSTLDRFREAERLQRTILDNLDDAVVLTDPAGQVIMVNEGDQAQVLPCAAGRDAGTFARVRCRRAASRARRPARRANRVPG
jgi:PAS domain-containing protein